MTKFLVFVALFAFARAAILPSINPELLPKDLEYNPHPQYAYDYKVEDPITGDFKTHTESRDGDVVKGKYSLVESDGSERVVDYFSDPIHGFNAVVSNSVTGTVSHGIAPGVVAPGVVAPGVSPAGPIDAKLATPIAKVASPIPIAPAVAAKALPAQLNRFASPYTFGAYPYSGFPRGSYPYGGYPYGVSPYTSGYFPKFF